MDDKHDLKHSQLSVMGIRKIRGRLLRSNTNLCQFHDSIFNFEYDV